MIRRVAGAAMTLVALAAQVTPAGADPAIRIDVGTVSPGHTVVVTGQGWEPGTLVTLEICGKRGTGGSVDCAVSGQRTATVDDRGGFKEALAGAIPPAPCPCVIKATGFGTSAATTVPIVVTGAPVDEAPPPDASTTPKLEIVGARLEGSGPWAAWFGASPERDLVVTLRNPGSQPVSGAELHVTAGKGEQPTRVVPSPPLGEVAPESSTVVRVAVSLGSLWFGESTVRVEVAGLSETPATSTTTSSYPWGLIAAALLVVQLVLLKLRNRVRRRLATAVDPTPTPVPEPAPPIAQERVDVLDLRSAIDALDAAADAIAVVRRQLAARVRLERSTHEPGSFTMDVYGEDRAARTGSVDGDRTT